MWAETREHLSIHFLLCPPERKTSLNDIKRSVIDFSFPSGFRLWHESRFIRRTRFSGNLKGHFKLETFPMKWWIAANRNLQKTKHRFLPATNLKFRFIWHSSHWLHPIVCILMKTLARKSKRVSPNRTGVINHAKVLRTFAKNNLTSLGRPRHELAHKTPLKFLTSRVCMTLSSVQAGSSRKKKNCQTFLANLWGGWRKSFWN